MGCGGSKKATNGTQLMPVRLGVTPRLSVSSSPTSEPPRIVKQDINEDVHCPECLKTWKNKNSRSHYHICTPAEDRGYQSERLAECNECEHNRLGVCLRTKNEAADKAGVIARGVKVPWAKCPDGRWDRVMIKCPLCSRSLFDENGPRSCHYCGWRICRAIPNNGFDILPRDVLVITATDQKMLRGVYMLAWTLMRSNEVRIRCYDLGIDAANPMKAQMESWGVEFVEPPFFIAPKNVKGWQTFNKPVYIQHAMATDKIVIWLDADTSVSGSIREATELARKGFFIPDHRSVVEFVRRGLVIDPFINGNSEAIYDVLGHPKTQWDNADHPAHWPCAAMIGVEQLRDTEVIREWIRRITIAVNSPIRDMLTYYDQSVLQDVLENVTPVDGTKWNNLKALRSGTQHAILEDAYGDKKRIVSHYGGSMKPWDTWPAVIDWGHPRGS